MPAGSAVNTYLPPVYFASETTAFLQGLHNAFGTGDAAAGGKSEAIPWK